MKRFLASEARVNAPQSAPIGRMDLVTGGVQKNSQITFMPPSLHRFPALAV